MLNGNLGEGVRVAGGYNKSRGTQQEQERMGQRNAKKYFPFLQIDDQKKINWFENFNLV